MLSARRLGDMGWFLSGEKCYLLVAHAEGNYLHVNLGSVTAVPEDFAMIMVASELWSSKIFTVRPRFTLSDILKTFSKSASFDSPIELVYGFGGYLFHQSPVIAHNEIPQ